MKRDLQLAANMLNDKRRGLSAFVTLVSAVLAAVPNRSDAQQPMPTVFSGAPSAAWVSPPDVAPDGFGVFHFRRTFSLPAKPDRFVIHVSADNRYRLFANGEMVSSGPQRSDLMHWRYETVDLAPHLRPGRNVLAALVWNWGAERPVAQFSRRSALPGPRRQSGASPWSTPARSGRCFRNAGYAPIPVRLGTYYASPPGEAVDGRHMPWGWESG